MAIKKSASKVSKKAELNLEPNRPTKRNTRKVKNNVKKLTFKTICVSLCLLVGFAVIGFAVAKYLTKDDCFEIIGKDEITLTIGEYYVDEGVSVVAFGIDCTDKVVIDTDLKQNDKGYYADEEGTFYIRYSVNNFKYSKLFKVQKIRLITFLEPSDDTTLEENNE